MRTRRSELIALIRISDGARDIRVTLRIDHQEPRRGRNRKTRGVSPESRSGRPPLLLPALAIGPVPLSDAGGEGPMAQDGTR